MKKKKTEKETKKRKKNEWFQQEESQNTTVYVSGLPPATITVEVFEELMKRYGIIQIDPVRNKGKVKLYIDRQTGVPKGDGIVTYVKRESVDLAIKLLDGAPCPYDATLKMTIKPAEWKLKGDTYDPKKARKRRKLTKREKETLAKREGKLFAWKDTDEMTNVIADQDKEKTFVNQKILIFKNVFKDPNFFKRYPMMTETIRSTLRSMVNTSLENSVQFESEGKGDKVKKVILFSRNPLGVCSVAFKNKSHALYIKENLDNKMFLVKGAVPQKLSVDFWDGNTNYMIEETEEEKEERDKKWLEFLDGKDE